MAKRNNSNNIYESKRTNKKTTFDKLSGSGGGSLRSNSLESEAKKLFGHRATSEDHLSRGSQNFQSASPVNNKKLTPYLHKTVYKKESSKPVAVSKTSRQSLDRNFIKSAHHLAISNNPPPS